MSTLKSRGLRSIPAFVGAVFALAALMFVGLFAFASSAYADDDLQVGSIDADLTAQSNVSTNYAVVLPVAGADVAQIYPADSYGRKTADRWSETSSSSETSRHSVTTLFIGSNVTSMLSMRYYDGLYWYIDYLYKSFPNIHKVIFLLDNYGKNSCYELKESCFVNLTLLDEIQNFDKTAVKVLPDEMCMGCEHLVGISMPDSVITIGRNAFNGCTQLNDVQFSANLKSIGARAFLACEHLGVQGRAIDLPATLDEIGDEAFRNCSMLHTLILRNPNKLVTLLGAYNSAMYGNFSGTNLQRVFVYNYFLPNYKDENATPSWKYHRNKIRGWMEVSSVGSATYDGKAKTPAVTVTWMGNKLDAKNYELSWKNNVNAGTGVVTATAIGSYAMSTDYWSGTFNEKKNTYKLHADGTFPIAKASISGAKVTVSPTSYTYDGKEKKPSVSVVLGGKVLSAASDYTVSYSNNKNVGTATVTVTGKGNYAGTAKGTFTIKAAPNNNGNNNNNGNSGNNQPTGSATPERLKGDVALDTMREIVKVGWSGTVGGTVVLTTQEGYWDALTAAGVAGMARASVLMTSTTTLSAQTEATIRELAPSRIVVCGGNAAVTDETAQAAAAAAGGAEIVRCWGQTATGTAVSAFQKAVSEGFGAWSNQAFVCTNEGYWDALAAAPISYAKRMPIFLTEGSSGISDETLSAMRDGGIQSVYIVGGEAAINASVAARIESYGIRVSDRLWGNTAVETSQAVAEFGLSLNMSCYKMGVATTNGYWDALAGAPLCGLNNSVLVLATDSSSSSISGFVASHKSQISKCYVYGGEAALDADTYNAIQNALA